MGPAIYLHWGGSEVETLLRECMAFMHGRLDDVGYITARCIGLAHSKIIKYNTGLGTWNAPTEDGLRKREDGQWKYSHGDAGVFIISVHPDRWEIEYFGGYGFRQPGDEDAYSGEPRRVTWKP